MNERDPLEIDPETMRRLGYRVVDAIVERLSGLDSEAAWRGASREALERRLRTPPPATGESFEEILVQLTDEVLTWSARVDHPRFMAFVPGSATWPGVLADFLAGGYNTFQGTWLGSSGASAVEVIVLDWFKEWLGMPASTGGLFLSGGSAANLTAIACARRARFGGHDRRAVIYLSTESHSSVIRAARILGFHEDQIRLLAVDEAFRLTLSTLRDAVDADLAAGRLPFLVVANGGATSTGAVDPLAGLAALCRERNLWLHVDAAYGGFAVLTERGRSLLGGLAEADSITLDPHKWLYQPFEAGCLLVRDGGTLVDAFRVLPDYLQDAAVPESAREVNFADRGLQLTRSPRALKVWASLKYFGVARFAETIDRTLDLADHAAAAIDARPALERLAGPNLGVVCFRWRGDGSAGESDLERINVRIVRALAESGAGMLSSTRLHGRYAIRMCILNHGTRRADVDKVLDWLAAHGEQD